MALSKKHILTDIVLLFLFADLSSCFYESEESKVITLDEAVISLVVCATHNSYRVEQYLILLYLQNFDKQVMESDDSFWLIEFYAPWCGTC